jgi:hypothetical protein
MRFRTCRRCGCAYNRAGDLVCVECHVLLSLARRPRTERPPAPAAAVAPPRHHLALRSRAGEPISAHRLDLDETTTTDTRGTRLVLSLIMVATALLVILAARGI